MKKVSQKKVSVCPESHAKWYCLNGATCFSITIGNSTLYNCWCPTGYHGLRCDYKYISNHTSFNEAAQSLDDSNYNQLSISLALGPPNRNGKFESLNYELVLDYLLINRGGCCFYNHV